MRYNGDWYYNEYVTDIHNHTHSHLSIVTLTKLCAGYGYTNLIIKVCNCSFSCEQIVIRTALGTRESSVDLRIC